MNATCCVHSQPDTSATVKYDFASLSLIGWCRMATWNNSGADREAHSPTSRFGRVLDLLWPLAALGILAWSAFDTMTVIDPGEVAVRVNNITGHQDAVTRPGLVMQLPFGIHSVYVIDASPQAFSMAGTQDVDDLHVRELTVRASDGSNFQFKDTTVIFQVIGDQTVDAVRDAGVDTGFRQWMRPYARSLLRDEFGRESTISVSDPSNFGEATERARLRMNENLAHHGVTVTRIVTPRPTFNETYEGLIESRNEAENQLSVIRSELERAATERERTLAEVDRDRNKDIQVKRAELESALATAVAEQSHAKRESDTYAIETVARGQADLSAAQRQALELRGQLEADYRAKQAEISAFRSQPVERVMERLGERLKGVTIEIQPWSNDAAPSRIQVENTGATR